MTKTVFHRAGPMVPTRVPHPNPISGYDADLTYLQRCTRCACVLATRTLPIEIYTEGMIVERGEDHQPDGVHVKYNAIPVYDVEARYRAQGKAIPWCEETAF